MFNHRFFNIERDGDALLITVWLLTYARVGVIAMMSWNGKEFYYRFGNKRGWVKNAT